MKHDIVSGKPDSQDYDCLVLGVHAKGKLPDATQAVDKAADSAIKKLIKRGDHDGKVGAIVTLYDLPGVKAERVMLLGLGDASTLDDTAWRKAMTAAVKALAGTGTSNALIALSASGYSGSTVAGRARLCAESSGDALYKFDQMKNGKTGTKTAAGAKSKSSKGKKSKGLQRVDFLVGNARQVKAAAVGMQQGKAIADGTRLTRDLGNLPGNVCTPSYLADEARKLGKTHGLKVSVHDKARMEKLKMNTLLSVAKGSREEPKLIVMEYNGGRKNAAPVALVGKGITFDAGGISLKPAGKMDEMKYDMCGAASVFGTMAAIAGMKLKLNVVAIVPACENLPDGAANKPGDIIESMAGHTIEILNTDAEGRLILCDALTFTERFKPSAVVDIATLTGACVIALGAPASGLFSNDQKLADELLSAGQKSGDRAWQMPLWDDYSQQLNSNFADLANIGGREAGAVTAACFLSKFATAFKWAHLDIAGAAWRGGAAKGATGRPGGLLTQFLMDRAGLK